MTDLHKLLSKLGACNEAVKWSNGKSLQEAWATCERADWMLWLAGRMADREGWPSRKQIVALACTFAEDALPIFEKKYPNDDRTRKCIEIVRSYLRDEATIGDVRKARAAAAYAAADAADAADAAAYAADAATAAYAADAAAWNSAREKKMKEYCNLIRKELQISIEVAV